MPQVLRGGVVRTTCALLALALIAVAAQAHLIVFKDGFVLEGQVKRETKTYIDEASKEPILIPKGFFMIDDGARRIYFSPQQARVVERKAPPGEEVIHGRSATWLNPKNLPPLLEVLEATEWNDKLERTYRFRGPDGPIKVHQWLRLLTPSYALIDAPGKFFWSSAYQTRELGPEAVLALLAVAPELQPARAKDAVARAAQRFRIADFLVQAGWYDLADKELDRIAGEFADQKARAEAAKATVSRLRTRDLFEDIKRLHLAGRMAEGRRRLGEFPEKDASEQTVAEVRELKTEYDQTDERLRDTTRLLEELRRLATDTGAETLAVAAGVISREMGPESVGRLDAFLGQARQWERQRRNGRKPDLGPPELLSLAISGWLLGSPAAETRPETAQRVWRARHVVLEYLRTTDAAARQKLLAGFVKEAHYEATLDEILWMIPQLPPVEPLEEIGPKVQTMKVPFGRYKPQYLLQLPPEYRPTRPYPVLFVLHRAGEQPADMLKRWAEPAADNGYILVAPFWERGTTGLYTYSDREHAAVLDTLRDLRRRVQVDSDRVFLFGLGEGAVMAFDVGLAHPDLFAGVIPMGGGPETFSKVCWRNAQYLPFYVVTGNRAGPTQVAVRQQFENWILRSFPSLWVDYKGRGVEWYSAEVPYILDWMRPKQRAFPTQQLGIDGGGSSFGTEFCALRENSNHFYWLTADDVRPRYINNPEDWKNGVSPAMLTGRIDTEGNEVFLRATGLNQMTLWLGRNARGSTMIDFDRPLMVRVNLAALWNNRKVTPSLAVLLEDLYERGDRQQLFLAKIVLNLK
jgi:pimeloyl-ACP methyl ester carboxylesterase